MSLKEKINPCPPGAYPAVRRNRFGKLPLSYVTFPYTYLRMKYLLCFLVCLPVSAYILDYDSFRAKSDV